MVLLAALLAATLLPTPDPHPVLIVNSRFTPVPGGPSWTLKVRLYPKQAEIYQGADIPTLYGPIRFEVTRPGQHTRITRFEDIAKERSAVFGALSEPLVFVPTFQDLNHDGRLDFTLCERTGAYISDCSVFTVQSDGSVALLPIGESSSFRVLINLKPTCPVLEATPDGFCFSNPADDARRACLRWDSGLGAFH